MDVNSRFWSKVDKSGDCWMWIGGCISTGYGAFHPSKNQLVLAHRFVYELEIGPIPDGLVVDHECHNGTDCPGGRECPHRKCVTPGHLAVKTNGRNLAASHLHNSRKTHCPKGHEYTQDNTYIDRKGSRICIECRREYDRTPERVAKQRANRERRREERWLKGNLR